MKAKLANESFALRPETLMMREVANVESVDTSNDPVVENPNGDALDVRTAESAVMDVTTGAVTSGEPTCGRMMGSKLL